MKTSNRSLARALNKLSSPCSRVQKCEIISLIVIGGLVASLAWHLYTSQVLHLGYPRDTFLFRPIDRFMDYFNSIKMGQQGYLGARLISAGLPFFMLIFRALGTLPQYLAFGAYTLVFVSVLLAIALKSLQGIGTTTLSRLLYIASIVACSFPFLIAIDRSHVDNYTFLLLWAAAERYSKSRMREASLWITLAIAIKPQSALFLAIFLVDGIIGPMFLIPCAALAINGMALLLLPGGCLANVVALQGEFQKYSELYIVGSESLILNTSLFGLLKMIVYWMPESFGLSSAAEIAAFVRAMMTPYFTTSCLFFAVVCVIMLLFDMVIWQRFALLACCTCLLPYSGTPMRLLYLFIPLFLFLQRQHASKWDLAYSLLFGLLLIPKSYFHFTFSPLVPVSIPGEVSDIQISDPLLLLAMLALILGTAIRSRRRRKVTFRIFPVAGAA